MDIDNKRKTIDEIDSELFSLFAKRMRVSEEIARIKSEGNISILNTQREEEVLKNAESAVPDEYVTYAQTFANFVMELSRTRQRSIINSKTPERGRFFNEIKNPRPRVKNPRVAVQGVPGSFAGKAASNMYGDAKLEFLPNWEEVFKALCGGLVDYGVLPVENSTAGSVIDVYDLLLKYKCFIVKGIQLPVAHSLLGVPGSNISDIKNVYSHPHAFPQCGSFFEKHPELIKNPCFNTAIAAKMVAEAKDKSKAAIACAECSDIYGLDILEESIQDSSLNTTRFISISNKFELYPDANKISFVVSLPHVTGSLYRTLSKFALSGFNLTKIESRPDPDTPFEYYFYIDFIGSVKSENIVNLLSSLSVELPFFNFLGNYCE